MMDITNKGFWDTRYKKGVGSGVGSRGNFARQKEALVRRVIKEHGIQSVLDVGCGDLFWIKNVPIRDYVGLDFSEEVLAMNRKLKPEWRFKQLDFASENIGECADLVICFDVLIHQSSRRKYDFVMNNLLGAADKVLLISGWREPPAKHGPTLFFYETIYTTLKKRNIPYIDRMSYRESVILEATK